MNEREKKGSEELDRFNYFSYTVRAGKRIYYLDVKKDRRDELYLTITEIKKVLYGEGCDSQTVFEKHKIFLYRNDFGKFTEGLTQAMRFVHNKEEEAFEKQSIVRRPFQSDTSSSSLSKDDIENLEIEF